MTGNFCPAAHLHIVTERCASGDSAACGNKAVPPQLNIVRNMHHIIDFAALTDNRVSQCAAVNHRIAANLDIGLQDNPSHLRDFQMRRTRRKSETVTADIGTAMNNHAIAEQRIRNASIGTYRAISPHHHTVPDMSIGTDIAAIANLSARTDHRIRLENDIFTQHGIRVNIVRCALHRSRRSTVCGLREKHLDRLCHFAIGIIAQ